MLHDFICLKCGGQNLVYDKWVNCRDPVTIHPDEHIEYGPSMVYETFEFIGQSRFVCQACGDTLLHRSNSVVTEADLMKYLKMTLKERRNLERDYWDDLAQKTKEEDIQIMERLLRAED